MYVPMARPAVDRPSHLRPLPRPILHLGLLFTNTQYLPIPLPPTHVHAPPNAQIRRSRKLKIQHPFASTTVMVALTFLVFLVFMTRCAYAFVQACGTKIMHVPVKTNRFFNPTTENCASSNEDHSLDRTCWEVVDAPTFVLLFLWEVLPTASMVLLFRQVSGTY